jgi:hypothetical protein
VRLDWLKWRSDWMEGRATLTIVVSRMTISWPRQTTKRAIHRVRSLRASSRAMVWFVASTRIVTISGIITESRMIF